MSNVFSEYVSNRNRQVEGRTNRGVVTLEDLWLMTPLANHIYKVSGITLDGDRGVLNVDAFKCVLPKHLTRDCAYMLSDPGVIKMMGEGKLGLSIRPVVYRNGIAYSVYWCEMVVANVLDRNAMWLNQNYKEGSV